MPIRIKHRDKISALPQQPDISMVKIETMPFLRASYTALEAMFGVLYGSI